MLPILTDLNNLIEKKLKNVADPSEAGYDFPGGMEVILSSDLMEVLLKHQLKDCKLSHDELDNMIKNTEQYLVKLRNLYKSAYHHIVVSVRATKLHKMKLPKGFAYDARQISNHEKYTDALILLLVRIRSNKMKRKKAIKKLAQVKHAILT